MKEKEGISKRSWSMSISPPALRPIVPSYQVSLTADNIMELVSTCMVVLEKPLSHSGGQNTQYSESVVGFFVGARQERRGRASTC